MRTLRCISEVTHRLFYLILESLVSCQKPFCSITSQLEVLRWIVDMEEWQFPQISLDGFECGKTNANSYRTLYPVHTQPFVQTPLQPLILVHSLQGFPHGCVFMAFPLHTCKAKFLYVQLGLGRLSDSRPVTF